MSEETKPKSDCPCKRLRCERHGRCAECRSYHAERKKSTPACERESERAERRAARAARRENK